MKLSSFFFLQNDTNTAFLRAARAGDLPKLIEYLETEQVTDINTCNAVSLPVFKKKISPSQ